MSGHTTVIVDILRATSSMTAGLANGVKSILPVAALEEARMYQKKGWIISGERNGEKVSGFDLGNSPFEFMNKELEGKKIAMTTTNGTLAITKSRESKQIIIGSFLNLSTLTEYLKTQENPVLILCAGWKGKVNLEDTVFAGALANRLADHFETNSDSSLVAQSVYESAKNDVYSYLQKSSHVHRLKRLHITKDIEFCLRVDQYNVLPMLDNSGEIRLVNS
jgi:2-phosphosulfolactate phosphatase